MRKYLAPLVGATTMLWLVLATSVAESATRAWSCGWKSRLAVGLGFGYLGSRPGRPGSARLHRRLAARAVPCPRIGRANTHRP
jgi:hypothetical protein